MAETFDRIISRDIGIARVRIGGYTVAAGTKVIVLGMTIANKLAPGYPSVDIEHYDGTNYTYIVRGVPLTPGQTLAPCGEMNKLILKAGDGLFAKSDTAASLDVIVSILEIN